MNISNNKRKKESQDKIEKTFIQLIQKKEIENISVSDICKICNLNRSTFYANYVDIFDLAEKVKIRMGYEFSDYMHLENAEPSHNSNSYLKMFKHIKENQIFYRTYFKLESSTSPMPATFFHEDLAKKYYDNKHIDYHIEFFRAGLNAMIKKWLNGGCKESPAEMVEILNTEYKK